MDQAARRVDVGHLERARLADAESSAVHGHGHRAVEQPTDRAEQGCDLVAAQHHWQWRSLPRPPDPRDVGRARERHAEQEAHARHLDLQPRGAALLPPCTAEVRANVVLPEPLRLLPEVLHEPARGAEIVATGAGRVAGRRVATHNPIMSAKEESAGIPQGDNTTGQRGNGKSGGDYTSKQAVVW